MREFNIERPVVYCALQMYLLDSMRRLRAGLLSAKHGGYYFAVEIMRGGFLTSELSREQNAWPAAESLFWPTKQATDDNFHRAIETLVKQIAAHERVVIVVATHNQQSVEYTLQCADAHGLSRGVHIQFAQMMGVADHLSIPLAAAGHTVYKRVSYGPFHEIIPSVLQSLQYHSDSVREAAAVQLDLVSTELRRRLLHS